MPRTLALAATAWVGSIGSASADEPPVHLEVGFNTRHMGDTSIHEPTALRVRESERSFVDALAYTASLRFTRHTRYRTFLGAEAEAGMLATAGSSFAGAYALVGTRGDLGRVALLAEVASGHRWLRYHAGARDVGRWIVEPRVRAEVWSSSRFTLGAAMGTTVGMLDVWMVGVYVGVHSLSFGKH